MKLLLAIFLASISVQDSTITREELLGQFDPATHPDFVKIETQYTSKSGIYLRKATYEAFKEMYRKAKADGVDLTIISATRNFNYQKGIWDRKWQRTRYMGWQNLDKARDIMTYSSMPGTSRHHWGTDVDLNSLDNNYFTYGKGLEQYQWLVEHGPAFGFYQTYTSKSEGRTGYEEEKWHWSYLPLSKGYLKAYEVMITAEDIKGFKGAEVADSLQVIDHYVSGISSKLKD